MVCSKRATGHMVIGLGSSIVIYSFMNEQSTNAQQLIQHEAFFGGGGALILSVTHTHAAKLCCSNHISPRGNTEKIHGIVLTLQVSIRLI